MLSAQPSSCFPSCLAPSCLISAFQQRRVASRPRSISLAMLPWFCEYWGKPSQCLMLYGYSFTVSFSLLLSTTIAGATPIMLSWGRRAIGFGFPPPSWGNSWTFPRLGAAPRLLQPSCLVCILSLFWWLIIIINCNLFSQSFIFSPISYWWCPQAMFLWRFFQCTGEVVT